MPSVDQHLPVLRVRLIRIAKMPIQKKRILVVVPMIGIVMVLIEVHDWPVRLLLDVLHEKN